MEIKRSVLTVFVVGFVFFLIAPFVQSVPEVLADDDGECTIPQPNSWTWWELLSTSGPCVWAGRELDAELQFTGRVDIWIEDKKVIDDYLLYADLIWAQYFPRLYHRKDDGSLFSPLPIDESIGSPAYYGWYDNVIVLTYEGRLDSLWQDNISHAIILVDKRGILTTCPRYNNLGWHCHSAGNIDTDESIG